MQSYFYSFKPLLLSLALGVLLFSSGFAQSILEAEDAYFSSGTVDTEHAGFTGTGFVNTDNAVGEFVEWFIHVGQAGSDTLEFRYALGKAEIRAMEVYVNQALVDTIDFDDTNEFTNYVYKAVPTTLDSGLNRVRLLSINPEGAPNLDHLRLQADTLALPYYQLQVSSGAGGSVDTGLPGDSAQAGERVLVTATPEAGFSFAGWTGDTTASSNPLPLLVDRDMALQANFANALPAFPGAEGFGRFTTGGRGGTVIEVTNLNDNGPGSLRAAVNTPGARTIVFRVAGTIELNSPLVINQGDVTIAGQTAPGDGICLANYTFEVKANNVIVRYLRARMGDTYNQEADAFTARGVSQMIIDHCSFSWGIDEVASLYQNLNTSFQWNIVSESFFRSIHDKGDHGYGGIWGGDSASFHHNLIIHHTSRNPRFNGARYEANWNEHVDFRNNAIYNWGFNSAYGGNPSEIDGNKAHINVVNNYYKYGPATDPGSMRFRVVNPSADNTYGHSLWHVQGNDTYGYPQVLTDNWTYGVQGVSQAVKDEIRVNQPFAFHMDSTHSAAVAFEHILANAGVVRPHRDPIDRRLVREACTGTVTYGGQYSSFGPRGIIDTQSEVGGWPTLNGGTPPADTDQDGMPDIWEQNRGLDPNDPEDRNGDDDSDGYTNLEEYLNELVAAFTYVVRPLAVQAEADGDAINLSWTDIAEHEDAFILERSVDSSAFAPIATLPANTTTYQDENLGDGEYRYRLRTANAIDTSCYTEPVTALITTGLTAPLGNVAALSVYPNPMQQQLFLEVTLTQAEDLSLALYNVQGQQVATSGTWRLTPGTHRLEWQTPADLSPGLYNLTLRTSQGVRHLKLRKQ